MGKKNKQQKFQFEDEEVDHQSVKERTSKSVDLGSSDDEEANEDLSLKIVEKALQLRATKLVPDADCNGDGIGNPSDGGAGAGVVDVILNSAHLDEVETIGTSVAKSNGEVSASEVRELGSKKITKKRKKKVKNVGTGEHNVVIKEENKSETTGILDQVDSVELITNEITNNDVYRKLLRGPRYFDPPDSWGTCYNCGEEGHKAVNCTSVRRKKPCFVCGNLEHNAKNCSKARDCFICKKGGHRAKDCPEKHGDISSRSKVCLKCGDSGHDMFSCKNDYLDEDLKNIQCYICKKFGHLCCVNSTSNTRLEVSCYKCGDIGHTGLACSRLHGEASAAASPSSCYKCGEEGHFARECMSSTKVGKRNRDSSNPKLKHRMEDINHLRSKSAPHDFVKGHKKKKSNHVESSTLPRNSGHKGHWMVDSGSLSNHKSKKSSWNPPAATLSSRGHSPVTPSRWGDSSITPSRWGHSPVAPPAWDHSPATPSGWGHAPVNPSDRGRYNNSDYRGHYTSRHGHYTSAHGHYTSPHGHYASPQSFAKTHALNPGTPMSSRSKNSFQNGHSASRFGDYSNEGRMRNYGWW